MIETVFLDAGGVLVNPNWDRVADALGRHGVATSAAALEAAEPHAKKQLDTGQAIQATNDTTRGWLYFNLVLTHAGIALSPATEAALKVMREQKSGAIVNISSLAALAGNNKIAYEISKAGVNRLTASIASANAKHGVRCNAVMPGLMDTPMAVVGNSVARGVPVEEVRAMRNARVPMGQMGTAWDTAYAALFLASDEAGFITGAALPVDGGTSVNFG